MPDHAPSPDRLAAVAAALDRVDVSLAGPKAVEARDEAHRAITEYLLPRVTHPEDALVVAVVGVSGSGTSTLVNSLARRRITDTGTIRPTTTEPIAWGGATLPATLDALRHRLPGRMVDTLRPPPDGVTIVDTPSPGVLDAAGAAIADQVLAVADACVLVVGAHRYADAAGFDLAVRAAERGLPTVFVLNRLPPTPEMQRILVADYAAKLHARGLIARAVPEAIVAIAEGVISSERAGLATDAVTGLRKEIERLADPANRAAVVAGVVARSIVNLERDLTAVRAGLIDAEVRRVELIDPVTLGYAAAADEVADLMRNGTFAALKDDRDRLVAAMAAATARRSGRAAAHAAERWEAMDAGRVRPDLFTHGGDTIAAAAERLGFWEADLARLAVEVGGRPIRGRAVARLTAAVRRMVLDPDHTPDRRERRLLRRYPGLVAAAAERLTEELAGIVAVDGARFTAVVAPPAPWGTFAELTVESV